MADTRAKLRAYFAERIDATHGVDNVAAWIEALGTALGKQDIVDGAGALAVYMVHYQDEKGGSPHRRWLLWSDTSRARALGLTRVTS